MLGSGDLTLIQLLELLRSRETYRAVVLLDLHDPVDAIVKNVED